MTVNRVTIAPCPNTFSMELPYLAECWESKTFADLWPGAFHTPEPYERGGSRRTIGDSALFLTKLFHTMISENRKELASLKWYPVAPPYRNPFEYIDVEKYQTLQRVAQEINAHKEKRKLFYLMLYARDLGYVHQESSVSVIEQILNELNFDEVTIEQCCLWAENYTLPTRIFFGEISVRTFDQLIAQFNDPSSPSYLQMLGLLSLLEFTDLMIDSRGLYSRVFNVMISLIDDLESRHFLRTSLVNKRLQWLASQVFLHDDYYAHLDNAICGYVREQNMREIFSSYDDDTSYKINRLLTEIDFDHSSEAFRSLSEQNLARLLKISAQCCFHDQSCSLLTVIVNPGELGMISLNQDLNVKSDEEIISKYICTQSETKALVWKLS